MTIRLFITGTDTNVGKTYCSVGLLRAFNQLNYSTLGIKPIASGCIIKNNQLFSEDALQLQAASSLQLPYAAINPFAYEPPIAPHIAANQIHAPLELAEIMKKMQPALHAPVDVQIIEGVGGFYVPLNSQHTMADFARETQSQVILVVSLRLGCLNHAILTAKAITDMQLPFVGWIANCIEGSTETDELIMTLNHWLKPACLGIIPPQGIPEHYLDVRTLLHKVESPEEKV